MLTLRPRCRNQRVLQQLQHLQPDFDKKGNANLQHNDRLRPITCKPDDERL